MTEKTTAKRENLARIANLVRPALAQKDYIPAFTHLRFGDGMVTAFNDVTAIGVTADINLERCVPGEMLIKALGSFGGEEVLFQKGKNDSLTLKSGRGTVTLPTLAFDAFPFKWFAKDEGEELKLEAQVVRAIERCLISVGSDGNHPAQMGVTLDTDGGKAVLYSTDNLTVSRCATTAKMKLPGDAPIILPRFFCEQLVSLYKAFPDSELLLVLHDGAVQVEFGDYATLLTKTLVDLVPLDFPRIVKKHTDLAKVKDTLSVIPNEFDSALGRALLVLGGEVLKAATFNVTEKEIEMTSTSSMGDAEDKMKFDNSGDDCTFQADAALLARGAKACAMIAFTDKVTIMGDAECNFLHFIAHADL